MPSPQRILIVRLGAMGDVIHALPGIAALRQAWPDATIGWAIEERWAELLASRAEILATSAKRSDARPLVDKVHFVNMKNWVAAPFAASTWSQIRAVKRELREQKYDLAIDIQGALKSALPAHWSGALVSGYATPREPVAKWLYKRTFAMRGSHVVEQGINLTAELTGQQEFATAFPLPVDAAAEAWRDTELARRDLRGYVMMTPGAGWGAKRWPAERYGAVARALREYGLQVLVNQSPGEEALAQEVCAASAGAAQPIACGIAQLIALVRKARLFIGGDTGPVHLAAALGKNVVAIYGPTNPARNGPFAPAGSPGKILVLRDPESVTDHSRHVAPERAMLNIQTEDVVDAAKSMLRAPASDAATGRES